jgi:diguanylate cyclase (GGDEF)-like protein
MLAMLTRFRRQAGPAPTLSPEIRAALVDSLFGPLPSLIIGAISCSIIGGFVAFRAGDTSIMATSAAIFGVGAVRVASAVLYRRSMRGSNPNATRIWEQTYKYGAWAFSALLGLLCWLTLNQTDDPILQMAVTTTAAGYAAAIAGRNAGHPATAVGQLTLISLPMAVGLLTCPDVIQKALGIVVCLFVFGMIDITLSIRDIIMQALTMTQKEATLAARFEEQALRFDAALNNMSHGLCMLDRDNRLLVWNSRFVELLHLSGAPLRIGMKMSHLLRHTIRAGNHQGKAPRDLFEAVFREATKSDFELVQTSPTGDRVLALSRRMTLDGGSVIILEDTTERKRAQEQIIHLAQYDDLTGLSNRAQFRKQIDLRLSRLRYVDGAVAIHLIDLDRFKSVNDTLGHPVGDKLLQEVSARLRKIVGDGDHITRFGGDEFVILQSSAKDVEGCSSLALQLLQSLGAPFEIDGHRIDIGASIGIAVAPDHGSDADHLLKKADMALYEAKRAGGGQYKFFAPEMESALQERRSLELDLRKAIITEAFELHYQPIVDLTSGRVVACEALLRWCHPDRGPISPSSFIPVAEETGLIIPLGEWVLRQACREAAHWPPEVTVAVNLSPVQFRDPGLVFTVFAALSHSGLPAQRLELEITERVLLEESESTLRAMEQLKELGVSISLDDFGTGYSSLNYLRKYPFDKIKIDQSFIHDVGEQTQAPPIIRAVASLGTGLNKLVVAEGIETKDQMMMVRNQGCHLGQGFFFGKAMASEAIRARLQGPGYAHQLVA